MDNSRPITCALAELTPLASELKDEGFTDARVKEATTEEELKVLGREVACTENALPTLLHVLTFTVIADIQVTILT